MAKSRANPILHALFGNHPCDHHVSSDDTMVSTIFFSYRMVVEMSERKKILPVPSGASMKNSPSFCFMIARIFLSYEVR